MSIWAVFHVVENVSTSYNSLHYVGLGDHWDYENNCDAFLIIVILMLVPYNRDVDFFKVHNEPLARRSS